MFWPAQRADFLPIVAPEWPYFAGKLPFARLRPATGCPHALTRFFSLLQEVRVMRKPHNPGQVKRRSYEHTEP